ncbi:hypothetical protein TCAL_16857 [Tigriopus californicus]|uniref:Transmembrane protein n=1 Tax=Tigriopus californicus TaxID=6832 RepID=A0A553PBR6_TIGCA|nr:hypothetical protein TCAL_16857 [Tigriopus californicus]
MHEIDGCCDDVSVDVDVSVEDLEIPMNSPTMGLVCHVVPWLLGNTSKMNASGLQWSSANSRGGCFGLLICFNLFLITMSLIAIAIKALDLCPRIEVGIRLFLFGDVVVIGIGLLSGPF